MLTEDSRGLVWIFGAFFVGGLFFQNVTLMLMGLVPLSFLLFGLAIGQPRHIVVRKPGDPVGAIVGDEIDRAAEVEISGGIGVVTAVEELPKEFELVEGSNFAACWKSMGNRRLLIAYRARCTKRGVHEVRTRWESRQPLGLKQTSFGEDEPTEITVRPRLIDVRRMRGPTTATGIPLPTGAVTRIGPPNMDFRELRQYVSGDPYRFINWKATARAVSRGNPLPVVNEYEREGKQLVWLFMDRSPYMALGTEVRNAFEHGLEAVHGLAHHYLGKGCMVGFCTFGGADVRLLHPDVGTKQYLRILREILGLRVWEKAGRSFENERFESGEPVAKAEGKDLAVAAEKCGRYLMGREPLCFVVSRFTEGTFQAHEEGIKELSKYSARGRRVSLIFINVLAYGLAARGPSAELAARALGASDKLIESRLKGLSLRWINWDPAEESITSAILRQAIKWRPLRAR